MGVITSLKNARSTTFIQTERTRKVKVQGLWPYQTHKRNSKHDLEFYHTRCLWRKCLAIPSHLECETATVIETGFDAYFNLS